MLNGDVTKDNLDDITRSIAAALGVDPSLIEISGFDARRQSSRRAPVSITFRLFVDADKRNAISALIESESFSNNLATELGRQNIQASVASTGPFPVISVGRHALLRLNTLQHAATHCNTLQHIATYCNILQHTTALCNKLQHTATLALGMLC